MQTINFLALADNRAFSPRSIIKFSALQCFSHILGLTFSCTPGVPEKAEMFDGEMDNFVSCTNDKHFTVMQKDQSIQLKNRQIFQKDQQDGLILQMKRQLNQKDQMIYKKDQLIKQKDQEIIEMQAKLKSSNVASKVSCQLNNIEKAVKILIIMTMNIKKEVGIDYIKK